MTSAIGGAYFIETIGEPDFIRNYKTVEFSHYATLTWSKVRAHPEYEEYGALK